MKIAALVLAAGLSSRYGPANKLLQVINNQPMVQGIVQAIYQSNVDKVVVVTGHEAEEIKSAVGTHKKVQFVHNPDYQRGMSTSIAAGVQDLEGFDACMICLGDLPYLTTADYNYFAEKFNQAQKLDEILVPTHRNLSGHPVIFGREFFNELASLADSDQGAKEIVQNNRTNVRKIEVEHPRILQDVDLPLDANET